MSLPSGYSKEPKSTPSSARIIGGIILLMIIIIPSALFWTGFSFDNSADNVDLEMNSCIRVATGATEVEVFMYNHNDYGVIIEWQGNTQTGYMELPAKSTGFDQVYSYDNLQTCKGKVLDVTRVP